MLELQPEQALQQAEAGLAACTAQGPRCPDAAQIRLAYLADLMREQARGGIDPQSQPLAAKQLVQAALRATKATVPPAKPASKSPAADPAAGKSTPPHAP